MSRRWYKKMGWILTLPDGKDLTTFYQRVPPSSLILDAVLRRFQQELLKFLPWSEGFMWVASIRTSLGLLGLCLFLYVTSTFTQMFEAYSFWCLWIKRRSISCCPTTSIKKYNFKALFPEYIVLPFWGNETFRCLISCYYGFWILYLCSRYY